MHLLDAHGVTLKAMPAPLRDQHDANDAFQETAARFAKSSEPSKLTNARAGCNDGYRAFVDREEGIGAMRNSKPIGIGRLGES